MRDFKCRMCGGELHIDDDNATIAECEYCGSKMTLPGTVDNDQLRSAFMRADEERRACNFDKAITTYERILAADPDDPEAHWGIALSRYGIEYVEDPISKKRVPTCHRLQRVPITTDSDYLKAVENANSEAARALYQEQATEILTIQRKILDIAENEEAYDIFISFKDKDENGKRTIDSVRAQEIYNNLTDKGYRVFFSRISLEDKIGEYEPYIFSAITTARVMIIIGTKPEYFNAVWVRNEWSRYLALMKDDRKRRILPCYTNMDPYDLPEELSLFQAYDMARIGFIEDLVHGIGKVIPREKKEESVPVVDHIESSTLANTLKRGDILLSIGNFEEADKYYVDALGIDPECASGYIGRLLCAEKCRTRDELVSKAFVDEKNANYILACKFATGKDQEFLLQLSNNEKRMLYLVNTFRNSISREKAIKLLVDDLCKKFRYYSIEIESKALQSQYLSMVDSVFDGYVEAKIIPNFYMVANQPDDIILNSWKNDFNYSWASYARNTSLCEALERIFIKPSNYVPPANQNVKVSEESHSGRTILFIICLAAGIIMLLTYRGFGGFLIVLAFFIKFPKVCFIILGILFVLGIVISVFAIL